MWRCWLPRQTLSMCSMLLSVSALVTLSLFLAHSSCYTRPIISLFFGIFRYCSNYYKDSTESAGLCDWCRCEEIKSSWKVNLVQSNKSSVGDDQNNYQRDEKNKYGVSFRQDGSNTRGRSPGGAGPSSRTPGRRYKLLKDVLS